MSEINGKIKRISDYGIKKLLGTTEENDNLLGIKIDRSSKKIEHRDYKDRNKSNKLTK